MFLVMNDEEMVIWVLILMDLEIIFLILSRKCD
jgi:hypothetical protein